MKKNYTLLVFGLLLSTFSFGQINAVDDTFGVVYGASQVTAGDLLVNDLLNGFSTSLSAVTITQLSTTNPGVSLSGANVIVAGGTPRGTYTLTYKICSIANSTLCDTGTVTVNTQLTANPDSFVSVCFNNYVGNVLGSGSDLNYVDTLNGVPAILTPFYTQPGNVLHPADVYLNVLSTYPGIQVTNNGDILVLQQIPPGHYVVTYELREIAHPTNFSIGYIDINVPPPSIYAQNDDFSTSPIDSTVGGSPGNVFNNDFSDCLGPLNQFNTNLQATSIPPGITLLPDGTITVAVGTAPGVYIIDYTVCETSFGACSTASAYVTVIGSSVLVANYDDFGGGNYPNTTITTSVLSNDTVSGSPFLPSAVILTPLNVPVGFTINSNGNITIAATVVEGSYTFPYQICLASAPGDCYVNYAYVVVFKNRIKGRVKFDRNANGCDINDPYLTDISVKNVNGATTYSSSTRPYDDSTYNLVGDSGVNTVTVTGLPSYFTITPASQSFTFSSPSTAFFGDFCVTANSTVNDLEIVLIPLFNVVPGLPAFYNIYFKNNGSTNLSGQITFEFDNTKMSFLLSDPNPDSVTANTMVYNYVNLFPFESRLIRNVKFQVATPPTVDSGQVIPFTASITPVATDNTPTNNTSTVNQTVVNSQDPNDIIVHEGAEITLAQAQQGYLHYTIRFQNIGTSDAINIKVLNDLDAKLDWSTFKLISTSHNCRVKNKNNHNEFLFENINLPGVLNEAVSHGYISFKVKPISTIAIGNVIPNSANIYFDYNAPIATNTASTTIIPNLGVGNFAFDHFKFFPNPVKSTLSVSNASTIDAIEITSLVGQKMLSEKVNELQTEINLSAFSNGIYFVKVTSEGQEKTIKIVKE
ncbi:MAG: T9SS type A sorting domain-containing protein [Burkholderiales bacterium]|nr:T9SS type A sorting domain-containing protein [Flavobacterium sp.]